MQLRQGKIIEKQKMQELSSLFMTHRINVMHALVKFHGPDTKVGLTDGQTDGRTDRRTDVRDGQG